MPRSPATGFSTILGIDKKGPRLFILVRSGNCSTPGEPSHSIPQSIRGTPGEPYTFHFPRWSETRQGDATADRPHSTILQAPGSRPPDWFGGTSVTKFRCA
ncbi:hypothetical protein PAPYR_9651 [Paratrimastix pyriformis]|uniref:Uncharacterized protein n=1 Tax=Paratrimastix pyriformis TaxID=342808 RepID=A0ABQ8U7W8_9EUKA|nr:hypothetical protein PAPYR_9651 [Paratrimastix pyriformis]